MEEHSSNKYPESFTSRGIPWELFFQIECKTSDQAYKLEKFIKKMKSSKFIKRLKKDHEYLAAVLYLMDIFCLGKIANVRKMGILLGSIRK